MKCRIVKDRKVRGRTALNSSKIVTYRSEEGRPDDMLIIAGGGSMDGEFGMDVESCTATNIMRDFN